MDIEFFTLSFLSHTQPPSQENPQKLLEDPPTQEIILDTKFTHLHTRRKNYEF